MRKLLLIVLSIASLLQSNQAKARRLLVRGRTAGGQDKKPHVQAARSQPYMSDHEPQNEIAQIVSRMKALKLTQTQSHSPQNPGGVVNVMPQSPISQLPNPSQSIQSFKNTTISTTTSSQQQAPQTTTQTAPRAHAASQPTAPQQTVQQPIPKQSSMKTVITGTNNDCSPALIVDPAQAPPRGKPMSSPSGNIANLLSRKRRQVTC